MLPLQFEGLSEDGVQEVEKLQPPSSQLQSPCGVAQGDGDDHHLHCLQSI